MHYFDDDNLPYFRFNSFPNDGLLHHAIFTRHGGVSPAPFASLNLSVSVPDTKDNVYANRRRAYGTVGRDTDTVVHAYLVHGNDVAQVTQDNNGSWVPCVDGIITDEPGCVLTMNFADCAPIMLYDPHNRAIGLGHAGWKGAMVDLPGAIVRAMQQAFGSEPHSLLAAIGPCIGPCCYEVGEDVVSAARKAFRRPASLFHDNGGSRPHFDLPTANRRNLQRAGVRHIEMSGLCTSCRNDLFYSHRADKGRTGRFGTLLMLGED